MTTENKEVQSVFSKTPVIVRNGVQLTFVEQTFGKRSTNNAGMKFFTPVGTLENMTAFTTWYGVEDVLNGLNKITRQIFAGIFTDNLNEETGEFNEAQWYLDAADFSAGVEKLSDIEDQLDNLQDIQLQLSDELGNVPEEDEKLRLTIKENNVKIRALKVAREEIKTKYEARAAKRKTKEEKAMIAAKRKSKEEKPVTAAQS